MPPKVAEQRGRRLANIRQGASWQQALEHFLAGDGEEQSHQDIVDHEMKGKAVTMTGIRFVGRRGVLWLGPIAIGAMGRRRVANR